MSRLMCEELTLTIKDIDVPADPELSRQPLVKLAAKCKREKTAKENNSVSFLPRSLSNLIFIVDR